MSNIDILRSKCQSVNQINKGQQPIEQIIKIGKQVGFKNCMNRKIFWPILLEINHKQMQNNLKFCSWYDKNKKSPKFQQLQQDAFRAFAHLKEYQLLNNQVIIGKKKQLLRILEGISQNEPRYNYYQGFHDIASVFLIYFGIDFGYHLTHKLARTYFQDYFLFSFDETLTIEMELIYNLVVTEDKQFQKIFTDKKLNLSFTISWILTWFAHVFENLEVIARIWDYLLSSQPSAIIKLSASFILKTKNQLLEFIKIENNSVPQIGIIHMFYQNLSHLTLDIQEIIHFSCILDSKKKYQKEIFMSNLPQNSVKKGYENFAKIINKRKPIVRQQKRTKIIMKYSLLGGLLILGGALMVAKLKTANK